MRVSLLLIPLLLGCHAKFKKAAPLIDEARVQVVTVGGPYVELGDVYTGSALVDVAVAVVQDARAVNPTRRIAGAVKQADLSAAVSEGMAEALGSGPPFAITGDASVRPLVQLELESYGLYVPYLGAPGSFTFQARAQVYDATGQRIYRKRLSCAVAAGDPSVGEVMLGVVNNMAELERMSDEQINAAFADVAYYCGTLFAVKMRKHAG